MTTLKKKLIQIAFKIAELLLGKAKEEFGVSEAESPAKRIENDNETIPTTKGDLK